MGKRKISKEGPYWIDLVSGEEDHRSVKSENHPIINLTIEESNSN